MAYKLLSKATVVSVCLATVIFASMYWNLIIYLNDAIYLNTVTTERKHGSYGNHGMIKVSYDVLKKMNKSFSFFSHFSELYPNIDWNLYDYHCVNDAQMQLLMISIPIQNKRIILNQLQSSFSNIEHELLFTDFTLPFKDVTHKILYCKIPKVASTKFQTLLFGLNQNISLNLNYWAHGLNYWAHGNNTNETIWKRGKKNIRSIKQKFLSNRFGFKIKTIRQYINYIKDIQWTKFVIIRDPLSRSISAYTDKCKHKRKSCMNSISTYTPSYAEWLNNLKYIINSNDTQLNKYHLRYNGLQASFCQLPYILPYYDYIILYDKDYISQASKYMIHKMNNSSLSRFYYNWNYNNNNTMFDDYTSHSVTQSANKEINLLEQYFLNNSTLTNALNIYYNDYQYLPFDVPSFGKL